MSWMLKARVEVVAVDVGTDMGMDMGMDVGVDVDMVEPLSLWSPILGHIIQCRAKDAQWSPGM